MSRSVFKIIKFFLFISLLLSVNAYAQKEFRFFTIGTGGITGVYYSAGNSICKLVNQNFSQHRMRCGVETTAGSIFNLKAVRDNKLIFGLVQAGIHYEAYTAAGPFLGEIPYSSLRSLFSLHDEIFTVIAHPDSGIKQFSDLKGKVLDIGADGSGTQKGAKELLELAAYKESDFIRLSTLKPDQTTQALCTKKIDAYIYMIGHPARNAEESTTQCKARIIDISKDVGLKLEKIPYYSKAVIPSKMYENNPNEIHTYAVRSTLVTDESTEPELVYNLVKSVFENIERFKEMHPAFVGLSVKEMVKEGLTAPLHKGAVKYYKERGFL